MKRQVQPFQSREEFIKFVREVSPQADITSVLLFGQMHRAHGQLKHLVERKLEAVGLSWAKFRLLTNLLHAEEQGAAHGIHPSDLSERQGISRNTVSALISSLEKDGLINRDLHGGDRRKFLIRLTPKGRRLVRAQLGDQFEYVAQCFDTFDSTQRQTMLDLLMTLTSSLSEKARQCHPSSSPSAQEK